MDVSNKALLRASTKQLLEDQGVSWENKEEIEPILMAVEAIIDLYMLSDEKKKMSYYTTEFNKARVDLFNATVSYNNPENFKSLSNIILDHCIDFQNKRSSRDLRGGYGLN